MSGDDSCRACHDGVLTITVSVSNVGSERDTDVIAQARRAIRRARANAVTGFHGRRLALGRSGSRLVCGGVRRTTSGWRSDAGLLAQSSGRASEG